MAEQKKRLTKRRFFFALTGILISILSGCRTQSLPKHIPFDWKTDWGVQESFSIEIDTEGYHFPTSIAFVPEPGPGPKDVLYFVTELRGAVKVVTNDRSVSTFALNFFSSDPQQDMKELSGQFGMAGVCLDPEHGYVFVTFAYQDSKKFTYNNIVRFSTNPKSFSLKPSSQLDFKDVFSAYESGVQHQIGNCQVKDGLLYVGVGDAHISADSQKLDNFRGKILRLTLDGKPVGQNPFYVNDEIQNAANFIYAYGMRNPFALRMVEGKLFAADNGDEIDRFMEIHSGENYFWNGKDFSIGAKALAVFHPAIGPAQMDYVAKDSKLFPPEYTRRFFISTSAAPPGIISFPYGLEEGGLLGPPEHFLLYQGSRFQNVPGLSFGPDGLYVAPIYPNQEGRSPILKITYAPARAHPFRIGGGDLEPQTLMRMKGCFACHSMGEDRNAQSPSLGKEGLITRISERLQSKEYKQTVDVLDHVDREPYREYTPVRRKVLNAKGTEQIRVWLKYHLQEPRFDNPNSRMPNLGLSENEATRIADYLIGNPDQNMSLVDKVGHRVKQIYPSVRYRHLLYSFFIGILTTILCMVAIKRFKKT